MRQTPVCPLTANSGIGVAEELLEFISVGALQAVVAATSVTGHVAGVAEERVKTLAKKLIVATTGVAGQAAGVAVELIVVKTLARELIVATTGVAGQAAGIAVELIFGIQPVELVVTGIPNQHIALRVAGAIDIAGSGERQVFHIAGQGVRHRAQDGISVEKFIGIGLLDDPIARAVDMIAVIAKAALHPVLAGAAVEQVISRQTKKPVIPTAADTCH